MDPSYERKEAARKKRKDLSAQEVGVGYSLRKKPGPRGLQEDFCYSPTRRGQAALGKHR